MVEFLIVLALGAVIVWRVAVIRRVALHRARLRAEEMLDELAAAACAALATGADPARSRRCARAIDRYERTRDRVAQARTRRELDALVARHRLRLRAAGAATRGIARVREAIGPGVLVRR